MKNFPNVLLYACSAFLLFLCGPARAQKVRHLIFHVPGTPGLTYFGWAIAMVGDVDGDGRDDFCIGASAASLLVSSAGYAALYSGAHGGLIRFHLGAKAYDAFGGSVAGLGDVDGDGRADYAIGAIEDSLRTGRAVVYSGKAGRVLRVLRGSGKSSGFGYRLASLLDRKVDGFPRLVVGAPHENNRDGAVYVISLKDGKTKYRFAPVKGAQDEYGGGLANMGDLNGYGYEDFAISASQRTSTRGGSGYVELRSGKDGTLLRRISETQFGHHAYGDNIANAGDVDKDGVDDLLAGSCGMGYWISYVRVHSGKTGALLRYIPGNRITKQRFCMVGKAGDVNGDGYGDFLVGDLRSVQVIVYSGSTGYELLRFDTKSFSGHVMLGPFAFAGDLNQDGHPDWLVHGAELIPPRDEVLAISSRPLPLVTDRHFVSLSAGGTQRFSLGARSPHAGKLYLLMGTTGGMRPGLRLGQVTLPLNPSVYLSFTLRLPNTILVGSLGLLDSAGAAQASLGIPKGAPPGFVGLVLHHAFVVMNPKTLSFDLASNAASLLLVP